ncbi:MAG: hypothetical protein LBT29_00015 [Flavobacteriaceae bacterium]|jgi:hypothetical protein|nr:hypothetical protein [Flavobacteriaceae bacterium]
MNPSFEIKELRRFGKQDEFRDEPDWENQVNIACQNISNETFEFDIKQVEALCLAGKNDEAIKLLIEND